MLLHKTRFFCLIVFAGLACSLENSDIEGLLPLVRSLVNQDDSAAAAVENGFSYADRLAQREEELLANGHHLTDHSSFYKMAQFKKPSAEALRLAAMARQQLEATKILRAQLGLSNAESGEGLRALTSGFSVINNTCLTTPTCTSSKYRTYDGSCNNLNNPNLGKSNTVYRRLITPDYADGVEAPRAAKNGSALPGARFISVNAFNQGNKPLANATLALMQFGQLINHDFQQSSTFSFSNGSSISCCTSNWQMLDPSQLHPACLPIPVASDDKLFNPTNKTNITCMNFVRSVAGPRLDCSLGYADQINQNSHWLDASTVYGSNDATLQSLRKFSGGLLLTSVVNSRQLLPVSSGCTTDTCFYAGDSRVTEQPGLTLMHTIWMREHNRVAKALSGFNPTWTDEALFQEARRIVIAEMQHITYNEFLPSILNPTTVTQYGLAPLASGFFTNYSSVNSGPISNEFSTAAFRMGHSLVQGTVMLYDETGVNTGSYNLTDWFNNASKFTNDPTFYDSAIRGLLTQPSQSVDNSIINDMWNLLFKEPTRKTGFDIIALNIQRGRDHGLPSYNTYRGLCGLRKFANLSDLSTGSGTSSAVFSPTDAKILATWHNDIEDIDLYTGGVNELPSKTGGVVGPTFACLIGELFKQVKYSDRFFYELGGQPHSFTSAQLVEIKKASLARIFCDNSDGSILSAQPRAFIPASVTNARSLCSDQTQIPKLDLSRWVGEKLF